MARRPSNRLVRKAIREAIEPDLGRRGFVGKYPEFKREIGDEVHFVLFQTAKYGGSLSCAGAWARKVAAHGIAQTDFENRANIVRIAEIGVVESKRLAWRNIGDFYYANIVEDDEACRALVDEIAALLPRLDHWLKTREPNAGIDCTGHRMRTAESPLSLWHQASSMIGQFDIDAKMPSTPHRYRQREANLAPEYFVD